jgi:hypothetical protein
MAHRFARLGFAQTFAVISTAGVGAKTGALRVRGAYFPTNCLWSAGELLGFQS